ncbi:VanZ family protein [Pediococcus damnosus]|uniref:VanZ family protein n=1 Tax=Pediococcus damnosus TaxID=51663 RepID=UPI000A635C2F|nr:VanZ family protein [Pediococcus damnosus]GEA93489.1 hypothetical protein PDA01_13820 [Pediococcus damnosus]
MSLVVVLITIKKVVSAPSNFSKLVWLSLIVYVISVFWLILIPKDTTLESMLPYGAKLIGHAIVIAKPYSGLADSSRENVIMTIPAGIYLYLFTRHHHLNILEVILIALGTGIFNESIQFILDQTFRINRVVETMDVLDNSLGVFLGYYWLRISFIVQAHTKI